MKKRYRNYLPIVGLLFFLTIVGCSDDKKDPTGPDPTPSSTPPVKDLKLIGVRIDVNEFKNTGKFGLGLLATDKNGDAILSTKVGVSVKLDDTALSAAGNGFEVIPKSVKPVAAAILFDNSGSMRTNDPRKERGAAAKVFWEALLPEDSNNVVGLFAFGGCGTFRKLQDFTSDNTLLLQGIGRINASGSTPLYSATQNTIDALNTNYSADKNKRVALVLTDGKPNCGGKESVTIKLADRLGIPIYTVGLGPASDISGNTSTSAVRVVQNLALGTNGTYAAATDAAALKPIFESISLGSSRGQLIAFFGITPIPPAGTVIKGTVTFSSGGTQQTVSFAFVAPALSPELPFLEYESSDE